MNIKQTIIRIKNTLKSAKTAEFCMNRENEAINILPKNAQNPQKTAKNAGISEEATNKREVKATQPVESGRSMVEMLGVLAVIGVLSVAGIAGYQFAMNKYRANQIANELNLAGTQIALALARPHQEDFDLTLGSPYDEGTLSSGFAFTYGCGTDTTMEGCLADDTTYYETLSGLPEDLCKVVAQLTQNLSYLVEQRVNDTVDTMGTSCSGDNNEIVMLFAVDEDADIGLPDETEDSGGDFGDGSDGNNDSQGSDTSDDDTSSSGLFPEDWPFMPATYVNFNCESDDGCSAPYSICYHGLCIECLEDADCAESRWGNYCNRGTCSSSPVECVLNSDCAENEYCYNGNCYTAPNEICSDNSDCVDGQFCRDGKCKNDSCRSDADCPEGTYCGITGKCAEYECWNDVDCQIFGRGAVCYNYKCYAAECKSDNDCPLTGQPDYYKYCWIDGGCRNSECSSNTDCVALNKGTVCNNSRCYDACKSDADCLMSGQSNSYKYCHTDGKCYSKKRCKSDADCPLDSYPNSSKYCMADGTCSANECSSNEDCVSRGKGIVCLSSKCSTGCQSDADCPLPGQPGSSRYCRADGTCDSYECRDDIDCQMRGTGTKCVYEDYMYHCQEITQ